MDTDNKQDVRPIQLTDRSKEILKEIQVIKDMGDNRASQEFMALTEFTPFPKLPLEIRRSIWKSACFFARVIELERDGTDFKRVLLSRGNGFGIHGDIRVADRSRHPVPVLFFVCRESHDEAKRVYTLTRFDNSRHLEDMISSNSPFIQEHLACVIRKKSIWFNPLSDIVYLGEKSCLGTLWALLNTGIKISRIAIDVGIDNEDYCKCCFNIKLQCLKPFLGAQVDLLTRQLRLLQGLPVHAKNEAKIFPGCRDLKELFLSMKIAGPFDHEIQNWDRCVGFERYTAEKPYFPLVGTSRLSMDGYVEHLLATTQVPFAEPTWKGGQKPDLQLARLSKPVLPHLAFEIVAIHFPGRGEHRMLWWMAREIHGRTTCMCTFYPPRYSGPGNYFFKFMGYPNGVNAAKQLVAEEIAKCETMFKKKLVLVDPRKAVFPTSEFPPSRSEFVDKFERHWMAIGGDF